ncbi:hypothetical protein Pelo_4713 [Pelomyxa schiedti]|nr:hypothetical protein Pelo_4713 [Pelomyxa schiedti]
MALIGKAITNTEGDEEKWAVPPSWFQLHKVMGKHKEEVITWSQFIKFAHENGVGRPEVQHSSTNISLDKEFLAIRGCVDYLSDMGDIFHFWHSAFSFIRDGSHLQDQIIVLKPSWFNETMTSIINQLNPKFTDGTWALNQKAIVQALNPMAKLGMMMTISGKAFLSFSLLPNTSQNGRKTFWSTTAIKNGKMVACGRHLDFGFLPVELFSRVMSSMCNIPGVEEPILFWQNGLLIYRFLKPDDKDHMYYLLMTRTEDSVTGKTQVEILVKSVCSANKEITWKDSLMIPAINFLHQIIESHFHFLVVQSFPCPQCMLTSSSHPAFFSQEEIIEAALDKTKQLVCRTHATQQLSSVAPDLFNLGFPVILADTIMEANSTAPTVTRTDCGERPVTLQATAWFPTSDKAPKALLSGKRILKEVTALSAIPEHPNVVKFFGACARGETMLRLSEQQPMLTLPPDLVDAPPGCASESLSLGALLKRCIQQQQGNDETLLERILPMRLREMILRNVARGLKHMHRQFPPIVHGDIQAGNVVITSLDPSGSGPWAKLTMPMAPRDTPTGRTVPSQSNGNMSPEAILHLNDLSCSPGTKSDVWAFGLLVHHIFAPLWLVALKPIVVARTHCHTTIPGYGTGTSTMSQVTSLCGPNYPDTAAATTTMTTMTKKLPQPGGTWVERFQVGHALSTRAFVVDVESSMDQATTMAGTVPGWARQLMECCLVPNPSFRPTIRALRAIWRLCSPLP